MPIVMSPKAKSFMQMPKRAVSFRSRIGQIEQAAATAATAESRITFTRWLSLRPLAPPRFGRPSTEGQFPNLLNWTVDGNGGVEFDLPGLEAEAKYWLVQEIGTGNSARILNPAGEVSVRSQKGRKISLALYWADGPGSSPSRPAAGVGTQQLYPVSALQSNSPAAQAIAARRAGRIRREIKGKHYIRDGGLEGMSVFRDMMLADFNKTFR